MTTIHQNFTADHTLALDAALRDARTQLPRTADEKRADKGFVLALNGHVRRESDTIALVKSQVERAPWVHVTYTVHSRGGCDCVDGVRRREQMPDAAPGVRGCKHWYAACLTAMAHLNLALKGYVPEAVTPVYPAVALDEEHYGMPVRASENADGSWWAAFYNGEGGFYTDSLRLELWELTPEHVTAWANAVRSWERWLQG